MGMFDDLAPQSGGSPASGGMFSDLMPTKPKTPTKKDPTTLERFMAFPAGVNRTVVNLLGVPVDTIANAIDLSKAGIGYATSKVTGKAPPEWTMPLDRSEVIGSGDWIAKKITNTTKAASDAMGAKMYSPVEPPRPDDSSSRVIFSGGLLAGSSINPDPRAKISATEHIVNTGLGAAGGLLSGWVNEKSPGTPWAGVVGMLPQLGAAAVAGGTKLAIRGGEEGRKQMEQRMTDLRNGGIDEPSVGLASGNRLVMGIENLLSQTPGSVGLFQNAKGRNLAGMQGKTNTLRDSISPEFGPVVAGEAIQSDLKGPFRNRINATAGALNDKVVQAVGPNRVVQIPETLARAEQLTTPIKGAEATSSQLINPRIAKIAENLRSDVYGAPAAPSFLVGDRPLNGPMSPTVEQQLVNNASIWNIPIDARQNSLGLPLTKPVESVPVSNPGLWNTPTAPFSPAPTRSQSVSKQDIPNASLWNAQKENGIPFAALKSLRTSIGEEAASNAIMGTPEQAQFKRLYGAMSQDMRQAVNAADRSNAGVPVGPLMPSQQSGAVALNRANDYYSKAMNRAEDLNSLANRSTPEGAYNAVANSLNAGPTVYERLRGTLDPKTRQKLVATIVDDLGRANPGAQNADGNEWSPRTFLTNFSKLNENDGGKALFTRLPGGQKHADDLKDIAKTAEMLGDASKIWANPSGTAPALTARATVGALTVGAFFHPITAAATAGGLGVAHGASRLLLSPIFTNWLAKAQNIKPTQMQNYAQQLINNAKMSGDKQFQQDVNDYMQSVNQSLNEGI